MISSFCQLGSKQERTIGKRAGGGGEKFKKNLFKNRPLITSVHMNVSTLLEQLAHEA
jgi:hypothetical protein